MKKNAKFKRIGDRLIRTLPEFDQIRDYGIKIAYLESDEEKKKNHKIIYGDCTKVNSRYKWTCGYDFFITIYVENILFFDDHQLETLIRHELHHIGVDEDGDEIKFYVVPHDVEEFWAIINDEGLTWDFEK